MNCSAKIRTSTTRRLLTAGILALLAVSCAETSRQQEVLPEQEACNRFKDLIADHANQFQKYKTNFTRLRNLNSWSVVKVFPDAQECKVWEWSSGLNNYICNWKSSEGEAGARTDHQEAVAIIRNCLGSDWRSSTNRTTSGGEHTLFENPATRTAVSMRYFRESRGWVRNWHAVLSIGDRSNLKAKTQ